jgi:flavin reductase (DIM6/NTAB) family NADH-FMN oxidoreductase RutF
MLRGQDDSANERIEKGTIMKKSLGAATILYPTPVWVIGSYDKGGKPNAMTASWAGICCSDPPAVTISIRRERHSYDNIMEKKAFTVNVPSEKYVKETDYFGIRSGKKEDKFSITGLTPVKSDIVDAPYIDEFPLAAECKLLHTLEVGAHTMFVGEILDVKADESVIGGDGTIDAEKLKTFLFDTSNLKYFRTGKYLAQGFSAGLEIAE